MIEAIKGAESAQLIRQLLGDEIDDEMLVHRHEVVNQLADPIGDSDEYRGFEFAHAGSTAYALRWLKPLFAALDLANAMADT